MSKGKNSEKRDVILPLPTQDSLISLLVKIPLFRGIGLSECREILKISLQKSYQPGENIYAAGTPGDEMLIILKGRVKILISGDREVAQLEAIQTVGEMEVVGSTPRVADVVADGEVSGLALGRRRLNALFESEATIGVQMLRNIVDNLAGKLAAADNELAVRFTQVRTEKRR